MRARPALAAGCLAALAAGGCGGDPAVRPGPAAPPATTPPAATVPSAALLTPGTDFTLAVRQQAALPDGALRLVLAKIKDDSRCPENVQCAWEGDATAVVTANGAPRELRLSAPVARVDAFKIRLVELAPARRSGAEISQGEYRATFRVEKG